MISFGAASAAAVRGSRVTHSRTPYAVPASISIARVALGQIAPTKPGDTTRAT